MKSERLIFLHFFLLNKSYTQYFSWIKTPLAKRKILFQEKEWIVTSAYSTEAYQWFLNVLDAGIEREKLTLRNRVKRKMKQWGAWILSRDKNSCDWQRSAPSSSWGADKRLGAF
jgi:hypothetical protein